jgi:hypothetical protein
MKAAEAGTDETVEAATMQMQRALKGEGLIGVTAQAAAGFLR